MSVVAKADETLLTRTKPQDLTDNLEWRDGRLIFNLTTWPKSRKNSIATIADNSSLPVPRAKSESAAASVRTMWTFLLPWSTVPWVLRWQNEGNTVILSKN